VLKCAKLIMLIGLALSFTLSGIGCVSAEPPSYFLGDPVTLRTTINNMGDTNVASSSFVIKVVSPGGEVFNAGSVEGGLVLPNEDIVIETEWSSVGAVPGTFSLVLEGEIRFANGAKQPVESVVEGAFTLVETMTGYKQVYTPGNNFTVLEVIPAQDSYYINGPIVIGALINNTGHILTSMSFRLIFIDSEGTRHECSLVDFPGDLSEPDLNYFNYVTFVPGDIPPGDYTCEFVSQSFGWSPPSNMSYGDYGWESFYRDYYVLPSEVGLDGYYDWAQYLVDQGLLPETNIYQADRWYRWHQDHEEGELPGPPTEYDQEWQADIEHEVSITYRVSSFYTHVYEPITGLEINDVEILDDTISGGGALDLDVFAENTGNQIIYVRFLASLEGPGGGVELTSINGVGKICGPGPFEHGLQFRAPADIAAGEYSLTLHASYSPVFPSDIFNRLLEEPEKYAPYTMDILASFLGDSTEIVEEYDIDIASYGWVSDGLHFSSGYQELVEEGALTVETLDYEYSGTITVAGTGGQTGGSETQESTGGSGIPGYTVEALLAGIVLTLVISRKTRQN